MAHLNMGGGITVSYCIEEVCDLTRSNLFSLNVNFVRYSILLCIGNIYWREKLKNLYDRT